MSHLFFFTQRVLFFWKTKPSFSAYGRGLCLLSSRSMAKQGKNIHKWILYYFPLMFSTAAVSLRDLYSIKLCCAEKDHIQPGIYIFMFIFLHFVSILSVYLGINFLSSTDTHVLQFNLKNVISSHNPRTKCYHN